MLAMVSSKTMTRKEVFWRGATAGIGSLTFGKPAVLWVDSLFDWYNLAGLSGVEQFELVAPVYLLLGALSWGLFGALAQFAEIVRSRGGKAVADKFLGKSDGNQ